MAKGIVRKLDELGRITIPMEYRNAIGAEKRQTLGMYYENSILYLFKVGEDFKGFTRDLDELGRWTIPSEIRSMFGDKPRQKMDIYIEDSEVYADTKVICIRKIGCMICSGTDKTIEVKGHMFCTKCATEIGDELQKASRPARTA